MMAAASIASGFDADQVPFDARCAHSAT